MQEFDFVLLRDTESPSNIGRILRAGILCVVFPFADLERLNSCGLLKRSGVYLLVGTTEPDKNGVPPLHPAVYVGKASTRAIGSGCLGRIDEHRRSFPARLDDVSYALVFTRLSDRFDATQCACMERFLCERIKKGGRFVLANRRRPSDGDIGPEMLAEMKCRIEDAARLAALCGFPFSDREAVSGSSGPPSEPIVAWLPSTEMTSARSDRHRPN